MDRQLRNEVLIEVRKVLRSVFETNKEVYVSGDRLASEIECFNKSWLKNYGEALPRTRAVVTDSNGKEHPGNWVYPLHQIKRMVANEEIKNLKIR